MARTLRAAQQTTSAGLTETFTAVDNVNGELMPYNNGRQALHVKCTGALCTVTVRDPVTVDGQAAPDRVITVPATTGDKVIGLQSSVYLQADGNVYVDYSISTGVTAALVGI
jgi:hypothetical protein